MDFGPTEGVSQEGFQEGIDIDREATFDEDLFRLPIKELVKRYPEKQEEIILSTIVGFQRNELFDSLDLFDALPFIVVRELLSSACSDLIIAHLSKFIKGTQDQKGLFDFLRRNLGQRIFQYLPLFSFDLTSLIDDISINPGIWVVAQNIRFFAESYHPYILEKSIEAGNFYTLLEHLQDFRGIDHKVLSKRLCQVIRDREKTHGDDNVVSEKLRDFDGTLEKFDAVDPSLIELFREKRRHRAIIQAIKMGFIEHPTKEDFDMLAELTNGEFLAVHWDRFKGVTEQEAFETIYLKTPNAILEHLEKFPSYPVERVIERYRADNRHIDLGKNAHHLPKAYQAECVRALFQEGNEMATNIIVPHLDQLQGLPLYVAKGLFYYRPESVLLHLSSFEQDAVDQQSFVDRVIDKEMTDVFFPYPKGLTQFDTRSIIKMLLARDLGRRVIKKLNFLSVEDQQWYARELYEDDTEFFFYNLRYFRGITFIPEKAKEEKEILEVLKHLESFENKKETLAFCLSRISSESKDYQQIRNRSLVDSLRFLCLDTWEMWLEQTDLADPAYRQVKVRVEEEVENILPKILKAGLPVEAKKIVALCKRYNLRVFSEMEEQVEKAEVPVETREKREIVEKPVDVLDDMTKFYTHQLMAIDFPTEKEREDARLHGIDLPVRTWVALADRTHTFEAHERRLAHWMKSYAVYAICHELAYQSESLLSSENENDVVLPSLQLTKEESQHQAMFSNPIDQFLSVATPTEIRRFLFQAEQRFLEKGWPAYFGGKAWAQICRVMMDVWKEDSPLSIQIDRIFDLQHNTGCIFDKRPDRVKEDESAIKGFLDFKFHQTGDHEKWKIGLRRFLDLDQSDALIEELDDFKRMRPKIVAFREQVQEEAGPRAAKYS